MKAWHMILATVAVSLLACGLLAQEGGAGEGKGPGPGRPNRGPDALMFIQRFFMENCDGFKTETERVREAVRKLLEERREYMKDKKAEVKDGEADKQAVKGEVRVKLIELNKKMIDEAIAHHKKVAELLAACKDSVAEKMVDARMERAEERRENKAGGEGGEVPDYIKARDKK